MHSAASKYMYHAVLVQITSTVCSSMDNTYCALSAVSGAIAYSDGILDNLERHETSRDSDGCRSGTGLSPPMQLGLEINAAEWGCPVARVSIDEKFQYQSS